MVKYFPIWFFIFLLFNKGYAQPDNIRFERVSPEEALTHSNVLCLLEDRKGFIWIGTYDGLSRYDGYSFKEYKFDPQDTSSLSQNLVMSLLEDSNGIIWVGTAGKGLCSFDPKTEKFTNYAFRNRRGKIFDTHAVSALEEDDHGNLWVGGTFGLYIWSPPSDQPRFIDFLGDQDKIYTVNSIYKDSFGSMWIGTLGHGLLKIAFDEDGLEMGKSIRQWQHDPGNKTSLGSNDVLSTYEDHTGAIWVGHIGGLDKMDNTTGAFIHFTHDPDDSLTISTNLLNSRTLTEDREGNLWIGTTNGLNKLNREREVFTKYFHDPQDPQSINSNDIHSLLIDNAGYLWVGTLNGGVSMSLLYPDRFALFRHKTPFPDALNGNKIRALFEDKEGLLWIGTEGGGLYRFDKKTGSMANYKNDPQKPNSLLSNLVSAVFEDSKGNVWIGYGGSNYYVNQGGLSKMDNSEGTFTHIPIQAIEGNGSDREVISITEDRDGFIWLGTQGGAKRFNPVSGELVHYLYDANKPNTISDSWCYFIFEDSRGFLWMGTGSKALNRLDNTTGEFTYFRHDPQDPNSISSHSVRHITEDKDGDLWFATNGGGLCHFDPVTAFFTCYTEKQGLPSNSVSRIEQDENGRFWLSTHNGICRFDPESKEVISFDQSDGLQSNQFTTGYVNGGSSARGQDGTLYFGGSNGFNFFNPADIQLNPRIPPVVITQIKVFEEPQSGASETEALTLPYSRNDVSFEFAALNFLNSHKNRYAYILENFDKDWNYSGSRRYASYTNLHPGKYVFRVKGSNNDGIWNETGTSIAITILPPWWQTWWAYSLYAVGVIMALWGTHKAVVNRERLKGDLKLRKMEAVKMQEIDRTKSAFFANISHEFRTPLTLISGTIERLSKQEESLSERVKAYGLIHRNTSRLHQLINQLLDLSKLEAGKLKVEEHPGEITAFMRNNAGSFVSLFESKQIAYRLQLTAWPVYVCFDPVKLEEIVSNLLSNAYKFTPQGGEVVFQMDVRPIGNGYHELRVTVKDSGIGIPKEKQRHIFKRFYQVESSSSRTYEGTGIGLSLVYELVRLLGGEITVKSEPGRGSVFELSLPLRAASKTDIPLPKYDLQWKQAAIPCLPDPFSAQHKALISSKSYKPLVLVVDDNPEMRQFIGESLKEHYRISEAENGKKGIETAVDIMPDLILSDVMMPVLDGVALSNNLKKDERTSHIPIILLTARADRDSRLEGLETGVDDYLTKPFQMEELLVRIKNLIESRKRLREKYKRKFSLEPSEITVTSTDQRFMTRMLSIMEDQHSNPEFSVESLSREIGMSRTQLHRKLKALIDQSPVEFIRIFRLKRAASLLTKSYGNVSDVAFSLGFNSLTYFTRSFRQYYGVTPSEFVQQKKARDTVEGAGNKVG